MSGNQSQRLELPPGEFRRLGHSVIDAIADYFEQQRDWPVRLPSQRSELESALHPVTEQGRPPDAVIADVMTHILPHCMHVNHPRFFAFVPGPSNQIGVLSETLASAFNVFAGTWLGGAAAIIVERQTLAWLCAELGLPPQAGGVLVSGGSNANLTGLALAVHQGAPRDGVAYFSDQTHSASERALRVLGFRTENLRRLPSDDLGRLSMDVLLSAFDSDAKAGLRPACVIANAGATSTGAVDPLADLADFCQSRKLWLHADAAYGGAAALAPRGKRLLAGLERCDTLALDPHKWLFQPFDIGCLLARSEQELVDAFRVMPAYLKDVYRHDAEINYCDRGMELTRPFRALKLWMSLQVFGAAAFRDAIERGFQLAEFAEQELRSDPFWEVLTPAQMAIVTFRPRVPGNCDEAVRAAADAMFHDGYAVLTTTTVRGMAALRLCTINPRTEEAEIRETIRKLAIMIQDRS